ncbi:MAG: DUF1800 family protein [Acidimicrobiales bacterium]
MPTSSADAALLGRRVGFGATKAQIDQWVLLDRAVLIDQLLDTSTPYAGPPPPPMGAASTAPEWEQFVLLGQWWMDRMAHSTTPIVEKMTLFWHGLFTTSLSKVFDPVAIANQHHFYRLHAVGNFETLVHGMALQPAMLDYLDNTWSGYWSPNQNFARELMELFLLGVGNYTEDDVVAAAAAWTGHSVDQTTGSYLFRPTWHDNNPKTFLGQTGNLDGPDTIDIMLQISPMRETMSRWIATKLWAFFAHTAPPTAAINAIAAKLLEAFNITDTLRVLFNRPEFYDTAQPSRVRSPIEYVVAILKGMPTATSAEIHPEWYLDDLGQFPFDPPTVEGWKHNNYWISTSSASAKASLASSTSYRVSQTTPPKHPFAGVTALSVPAAVQLAFDTFHILSPTTQTRNVLQTWLTNNRAVPHQGWFEPLGLMMMVLLCPEMQLA